MTSFAQIKDRIVQTTVFFSILTFLGLAQAQQGNDSGGSSSSGSASTSSGQSSQKPKSNDQSKSTDTGKEREKMDRNVKDTVQRDKEHKLKPSEYDPPK